MSAQNRSRRRLGALVVTSSLVFTGAVVAVVAAPADAASSTVVITEVYGGGGNSGAPYTHDFIELTNNSSAPVDVTRLVGPVRVRGGHDLAVTDADRQRSRRAPPTWSRRRQGAGGDHAAADPGRDRQIAMSATTGKVALVDQRPR